MHTLVLIVQNIVHLVCHHNLVHLVCKALCISVQCVLSTSQEALHI